MKKQRDYKVTVSGGIYKDFKVNDDGSVTITMEMHEDETEPAVKKEAGLTFVGIPVHTVCEEDDFLFYVPSNNNEIELRDRILKVLQENNNHFHDFFIPEDYSQVKLYNSPIHSHGYGSSSCNTWIGGAKQYNCTLLSFSQYIMLLAWMLKTLTEKVGWDNKKAWSAIACDSSVLTELDWKETFGIESFLTTVKKYLLPDDTEKQSGCYQAEGGLNGRDWKYPLGQVYYDSRRDCSKENCPYLIYGFLVLNK
ncbi:MAG: hypothetical protein K6B70_05745 [Clostridia bacterium]|nr:hypothetical protein [Clostridia bacterium]